MRFSRMLGPTQALADRALLQSAGGELLPTGERSDGLESFAGPARGRTSEPCPLLIACIAITLAACGTAGPGGSPYHASGRPEAAAVTPAVGVPARATGTPAPGGQPPAAGPGSTSAALNLRLLAKVTPSGGDGDLPVGPGDLIEVSVFEVEELSKLKLRIPARGMISLPLIGQVQAAGRTATELEDEIRTKLQQKFMHDPQVSVFVHEHNSQRVSVMGAVRRGGVITLNRQLRLADALATAEGLTDDAHHVVYVIRQVPAGTVSQLRASAAGGPGATSAARDIASR